MLSPKTRGWTNAPLYLIGGRDWRQRQVREASLDVASQSGAPAHKRVVTSEAAGDGDARSGCGHFQRFRRAWRRLLFARSKRPCSGGVGERRHKPAQGGHGCSRWGVVDGASASPRAPRSREKPWVIHVALGLKEMTVLKSLEGHRNKSVIFYRVLWFSLFSLSCTSRLVEFYCLFSYFYVGWPCPV